MTSKNHGWIVIGLIVGMLSVLFFCEQAHSYEKSDYIHAAKAQEWKHSIKRGLLVAVCDQETRFRPHEVSNKGAIGLCQIMPATFVRLIKQFQQDHDLFVDGDIGPKTWEAFRPGTKFVRMSNAHRLLDPFQNVEWAALYLKWIEKNVSDNPLVMAGVYYGGQRHHMVRYQLEVQARWQGGI